MYKFNLEPRIFWGNPSLEKIRKYLENKVLTPIYPPPNASPLRSKCQKPRKPKPQTKQDVESEDYFSYGSEEVLIYSSDEREQILTASEWPQSVHGVIIGRFKDKTFQGTGILIGPNIVLTAGHNLYRFKKKIYADCESLQFIPAANGMERPFGKIGVATYRTNYDKDRNEDYGILILKEPIGDMAGYFGLSCLEPEELALKKINIIGYPDDKGDSKSGKYEMLGMEGTVSRIEIQKGFVYYKIDTSKGQSGSGVFYEQNGEYFICGVHVRGYEKEKENAATLLNQSRYEQIYEWIEETVEKERLLYLEKGGSLKLYNSFLGVEEMRFLSKYNLDEITSLNFIDFFRESTTNADGVKALAQNEYWISLSQLNFSRSQIGDEGAKELGRNTSWINLSQLDLSGNQIGDEGAKELGRNTSWINLSGLYLSSNQIGDEGAKELGRNTSWINLLELYLSRNQIGDEGAKELGRNTSWINLLELHLSRNQIGYEGAKVLGQNTSWINLSQLDLSWNQIGDEGAKELGRNTSWINLSILTLSGNKIGDEGAKALGRNTSWINLSILTLSGNKIGDEGAKALGQNTSWINLSGLYLFCNQIGDEGAKALVQNPSWTKLSELHFYESKIGDARAQFFALIKNLKLDLAWSNTSYERVREFGISQQSTIYSPFNIFLKEVAQGISFSQATSIWNVIGSSKRFDQHKLAFQSILGSFAMRSISFQEFENFLQKISWMIHLKLDLNQMITDPEEEEQEEKEEANDERIIEETSLIKPPLAILNGDQTNREESNTSVQSNSYWNLNSNHLSAE